MFVPLVRVPRKQYALVMLLLPQLSGIKKRKKGERERAKKGKKRRNSRAVCKLPEENGLGRATRFHGAHTREDPLTFFQYEAQRDEQALRVGLREELSSGMQKYLRVKRLFMRVYVPFTPSHPHPLIPPSSHKTVSGFPPLDIFFVLIHLFFLLPI